MPVLFVLVVGFIFLMSAMVIFGTVIGVIRHRRLFDQISDRVAAELARDDGEQQDVKPVPCDYCGTLNPAGARCSACGASE